MVYYGDIEQVKKVLADNHITVVISYMMVLDEASSSAQLNLVKTAAKCDTVQRFIMGDLDSFTNCKFSVKDFGFSDSPMRENVNRVTSLPSYALREATASELRFRES